MRKEKRFPTIIGLLFLILAIAGGVYLNSTRTNLGSKASGDCKPINVQIANITHNSADISYTTGASCLSTISLNDQVINDVRFLNTNQSPSATKIHYFQAKYLKEKTEYHFSLITNGQTVTDNAYLFTTGSKPSSELPTSNLAWGRVLNPDKKTTSNAIVYLNIPGAAPLSSFITSNGNWSISLASSFNSQNNDWFTPPSNPVEEDIVVVADDGSITQVTNNTSLNNPVPDIIIGQNSLTVPPDYISGDQGIIDAISPVQTQKNITITNPTDKETLNINIPDFFGTGPINSTIVIEVHSSDPIVGQAQSDTSGTWHWSPPQSLEPGEHTITAKVQNPSTGLWESVTRTFTVLAQNNSNPAYEASASATTAPTVEPTIEPTIEPTQIPTITPTPIIRTAHPSSASAKPPVSGDSLPTVIIIGSAFAFLLLSLSLFK
jgi:hypothetical protein